MPLNSTDLPFDWILFDIDNTLIDFDQSQDKAFHGLDLMRTVQNDQQVHWYNVFKKINKSLWAAVEGGEILPTQLKQKRFALLLEAMDQPMTLAAAISEQYHQLLVENTTIDAAVVSLLSDVATLYKMAIVTNGLIEVQRPKIARLAINHFFNEIVVSEEIGYAKPDIRFFQVVLEKINYTNTTRIIMIGDTLASDIAGAQTLDIPTCWLNTAKIENKTTIVPTHEIYDLSDLKPILYLE